MQSFCSVPPQAARESDPCEEELGSRWWSGLQRKGTGHQWVGVGGTDVLLSRWHLSTDPRDGRVMAEVSQQIVWPCFLFC